MGRGSFFVKEHLLANMSFLSYAHVSRCARHAREPTRSLFICAVSPDLTPLDFSLGTCQKYGVRNCSGHQSSTDGQTKCCILRCQTESCHARPCWPIIAAMISNMQWDTGPTLNTYCKNLPCFTKIICVQLFVFNSDPYWRTRSPAHNS